MNTTNGYTNMSINNEVELLPIINIQEISDLFNSDGTFGWSDFLDHRELNMKNCYIQEEVGTLFNSSGTFEWSDFPCLVDYGNIKFQPKEVVHNPHVVPQPQMKLAPNLTPVPPSPTPYAQQSRRKFDTRRKKRS
jgi:hypothetical protein